MTPSRKPSRATVITASIAIGVFGAGAGLGTVIAARSEPPKSQVMRLAAGTYHLDDAAQLWKVGNDPVPLSGSDAGSAISNKGALEKSLTNTKVCLAATADGHAVSGGVGGCLGLPVLASAIAPLQRPGNPKTGTTKEAAPPKASSAPEPSRTAEVKPVKNTNPQQGGGGGGGGGGGANVQKAPDPAPVQPPKATTKPAPAPTKKVSGDISDSGSQIDKPVGNLAEKPKLGIGSSTGPKAVDDRAEKPQPDSPKQAKPTGTLKPALPNSTVKPTAPSGPVKPVPTHGTGQKAKLPSTAKQASPTPTPRPSGTLKPALPTAEPEPSGEIEQTLPTPDQEQNADGTVLKPADPPAQEGGTPDGADSLPVFKDPELLRRAQEALGLDKNMRYTDENGVWDLNIAPPGTPQCRNYSEEELHALGADQKGAVIPRDSCLWPAFVRWLYAEPAPGEVSNWTKFTGLPERNLEFVVTNPDPAQPGQNDQQGQTDQQGQQGQYDPDQPGQVGPDQQGQYGQQGQQGQNGQQGPAHHGQSGQSGPSGDFESAQPQPDQQTSRFDRSGELPPDQSGQSDPRGRRHVKPGPGQVEPYQDGHTGP
ncbi:hypothetical protein AB0395_28005 [Streptosporangium sp. NPDC051023]|uniref:hypothetical protein n=1 Tax=Streptosporangium sp. NPDC051023 TaxID=3155410 RepID=UPI00344FE5B0